MFGSVSCVLYDVFRNVPRGHTATHKLCNTLQHAATHCNTTSDLWEGRMFGNRFCRTFCMICLGMSTVSCVLYDVFRNVTWHTNTWHVFCMMCLGMSPVSECAMFGVACLCPWLQSLWHFCCIVLQHDAVCCSVLQRVAVFQSLWHFRLKTLHPRNLPSRIFRYLTVQIQIGRLV